MAFPRDHSFSDSFNCRESVGGLAEPHLEMSVAASSKEAQLRAHECAVEVVLLWIEHKRKDGVVAGFEQVGFQCGEGSAMRFDHV